MYLNEIYIYLGIYDSEDDIISLFKEQSTGQPFIFESFELAYQYINEMINQGLFATIIISKIPLGKTYGLPS